VTVVYGAQWRPAASVVGLLAVMGAIRVLANLAQDFLTAVARTRVVLVLQLAWLGVLVPALIIGAHVDGIRGVGFAHSLTAAAIALPLLVIALPRASDVPVKKVLGALSRPALAAGAGLVGGGLVLHEMGGSMQWELIVGLAVSALLFAMVALRAKEWQAARSMLGRTQS
jgi:O-antigen/teichoic acid export membrane protein